VSSRPSAPLYGSPAIHPGATGPHQGEPPGPPWGWRTEIAQPEPDRLVITHYNITPDGQEAMAIETDYRRIRQARRDE
jgi:hypothetical protein